MSSISAPAQSDGVTRALGALRAGAPVLVLDSADPRAFGVVVVAAEHADASAVHTLAKRSGFGTHLVLTDERCEELGLNSPVTSDDPLIRPPVTMTIAAREGVTLGVSAAERARTISVAIDPERGRGDIRYGGPVVVLRAAPGGVFERAGLAEAAVDLVRLGGLMPAAVLGEVVDDGGDVAERDQLLDFAAGEDMPVVTIAEIVARRRRSEPLIRKDVETTLPTTTGTYRVVGYVGLLDHAEHVAFIHGDVAGQDDVLAYIHHACWMGDVFHSSVCDCRARLDAALEAIADAGRGVVVHLSHPLAFRHPEPPEDGLLRDMGIGAQILADLGLTTVTLLSDHARGLPGVEGYGLSVVAYRPLLGAGSRPS